jgi:type IV pilus assembly protein PilQ
MKSIVSFILIVFSLTIGHTQSNDRLSLIKTQLENVAKTNKGLESQLDASIDLNEVTLSNFLLAISNVHNVSISVSPELNQMRVTNNFSNVTVANVSLFLCKEYNLTIEFTGDILSIKPFVPISEDQTHPITIDFNPSNETISIDTKQNSLYDVFKRIMDASAKNLLYAPGMENHQITSYIKTTNFDAAMDKLALSNNLTLTKTKDDFYVFDLLTTTESNGNKRNLRRRLHPNLGFKVIDSTRQLLEVNFENAKISDVIKTIGDSLKINIFLASPLEQAGLVTIKTNAITFDNLLIKMFEPQIKLKSKETGNSTTSSSSNRPTNEPENNKSYSIYTFKKEGNIYFFGTTNQLSVRKVEIITLNHRSVNLMPDPESGLNTNNVRNNFTTTNQGFGNQQNYNGGNTNFNRPQNNNTQN